LGFSKDVMAAKLRGKRAESGMTQKQVSDAIGVNIVTIGRYENAETIPAGDVFFKLAELYGCTPGELMGWQE